MYELSDEIESVVCFIHYCSLKNFFAAVMVLFSPMRVVSGKFGPLSFHNKLCVYMEVNYCAPEVFLACG